MPSALPVYISRTKAEFLAGGRVSLRYYPLTGVSFTATSVRGPAARIDARVFHTIVDRATGSVATSPAWPMETIDDVPEIVAQQHMTLDAAIDAARHTLTTVLLRKIRLAGSFSLETDQVIDPLWKPNWLHQDGNGRQVLVDALDGSVARRQLRAKR